MPGALLSTFHTLIYLILPVTLWDGFSTCGRFIAHVLICILYPWHYFTWNQSDSCFISKCGAAEDYDIIMATRWPQFLFRRHPLQDDPPSNTKCPTTQLQTLMLGSHNFFTIVWRLSLTVPFTEVLVLLLPLWAALSNHKVLSEGCRETDPHAVDGAGDEFSWESEKCSALNRKIKGCLDTALRGRLGEEGLG